MFIGEYLRAAALSSCCRSCCEWRCWWFGRCVLYLGLYGSASSIFTSPSLSLKSGPRLLGWLGDCSAIVLEREGAEGDVYGFCLSCAGALASRCVCCEGVVPCGAYRAWRLASGASE